MRIPIHHEGWPFIGLFALATLVLAALSPVLGLAGLALTLWCAWFFRDPDRVAPLDDDVLLSPADGVILPIVEAEPPPELGMEGGVARRVSVFMNVLNVHVNRAPFHGRIRRMVYTAGRFFNASLDKASKDNERMGLVFERDDGRAVAVVQVAGLVARRIRDNVQEGDSVVAGERFGLIRFGSRVDVYAPTDAEIRVREGQTAVGGETVLARLARKRRNAAKP